MKLLIALLLWLPLAAGAAIDVYDFDDPEQEQRFRELAHQMSCPRCQNQSILESEADIAGDMRRRTARMIQEGYSEEEILDHFRARYGDFVHYRPPLRTETLILWAGPITVLFAGGLLLFFLMRRAASAPLDEDPDETGPDTPDQRGEHRS